MTDLFGLANLPDPLPIATAAGPLEASVCVPGSKSITNRALVCAALASGTSTLTGALFSDDTEAMASVLATLGAGVDASPADARFVVAGVDGHVPPASGRLDTRQSGTTSRFALPLLALGAGTYEVTAHPQMQAGPMGATFEALEVLGASVVTVGEPGHLPARVVAGDRAAQATLAVPGDVSSQFLSGLLLVAPCLRDGLRLHVTTALVSRPYVDLTIDVMRAFGALVDEPDPNTFVVAPTGYQATDFAVEPDASAASYPLAAAAICGGSVRVEGLDLGSSQGDTAFAVQLRAMGLEVVDSSSPSPSSLPAASPGPPPPRPHRALDRSGAVGGSGEQPLTNRWIEVTSGPGALRGGTFDFTHISDTAQTLAVVAPFADGPVTIEGIGFIRRKEIDRVAAVAQELARCGVRVDTGADGWTIYPGPVHAAVVETFDDHRMAMSFALLGLRVPGMAIAGPGCVAKTYPGYWAMLEALRSSATGR